MPASLKLAGITLFTFTGQPWRERSQCQPGVPPSGLDACRDDL